LLAALAVLLCMITSIFWAPLVFIKSHELTLKHGTNHAAVLTACRGLMASSAPSGSRMLGSDLSLPATIRDLQPHALLVTPQKVEIELGGSMMSYGLIAFPAGSTIEAAETTSVKGQCRYDKLIPGLWLYWR
jgi:hypothetical protein